MMKKLKFQRAGVIPKTADETGRPSIFDVNPKKTRGVDYKHQPNVVEELAFGMMPGAGMVEGIVNAIQKGSITKDDVMTASADALSIIPGGKLAVKAASKAAPYLKNAAKNIKHINKPVYIYGEKPLIEALPKNLTKNVEDVKGAYKFQNTTTYGGKTFNPGEVIEESSARVKLSLPQYLQNRSAIKEALRKTGQESALAYTENPLALKKAQVIKEINTDPVEMVNKHGVTGASRVGNVTKAIKNLDTKGLNISMGNIFQNPKDAAASLIFRKRGGLIFKKGNSIPKYKGSGTKDACYRKVKARYKVWPSAYASGALSRCRKIGAANWGNKSK